MTKKTKVLKKHRDRGTISISSDLKERLRRRGEMGESYEDVIRKLLEKVEKMEKK